MSDAIWHDLKGWVSFKLDGMPQSYTGAVALEKRQGWRGLGEGFARKRAGRGGGWEYHLNCLPKAAQDDFLKREKMQADKAALQETEKSDQSVIEKSSQDLTARVAQVMEARNAVLLELDRRTILHNQPYEKAIDEFLAEAKAGVLCADLHKSLLLASDRRGKPTPPSKRSIKYWKSAKKEHGVAALAPKRAPQQKRQERPDYLNDFLRHFCKPGKPTIAEAMRAWSKVMDDPATQPSYDQVTRALKQLKGTANWLDAHRGREGALALKARQAFVRRSTEDLEPTEIYTSDGTTFDAEVAHPEHGRPFKPEITLTPDVATRRIVGWSAGLAENAEGVADALRHACERHGIPALFYTDRGSGFKNERLGKEAIGIAARLGITIDHARPRNAQARGLMERIHRTVLVPFAKTYPTYLGKGMDREASQRVHKRTRKDIAEFGESKALPTWSQFLADLEEAIEDYNNRPHSELPKIRDAITGKMRYQSPNEYWAHFEALGFEAFKVSDEESKDLFRPYKERQVRRCEIQLNTNRYFSIELSAFHEEYVYVGYDQHDASQVWVREIDHVDGEPAPGRLIAIATFASNETRYYPKSATEAAKEKRAKGRLKRVDAKRTEILEELDAPVMLSQHQSLDPLADLQRDVEIIDVTPITPIEQPKSQVGTDAPSSAPTGLYFDDDISLAKWALEHPSEMTAGQITILTSLVTRKSGRDLLEISGVDPDEIRMLLRSAA